MNYPEHLKLKALNGENQIIGNFLEWLGENKYEIASYRENDHHLAPSRKSIAQWCAEYFEVDLVILENEKQQMLEKIEQHNNV